VKIVVAMLVLAACSTERSLPDAEPVQGVHPDGFANPKKPDVFHGTTMARYRFDLKLCASCHGEDYAGGTAKVSCLVCHPQGPTACAVCHGDGPTSGAHLVHRETGKLACTECHAVPDRWDAEGHIRLDDSGALLPAPVTFGARASMTLVLADRKGPATYAAGACANVYCHGDVLHAGGGLATQPHWSDATPAGGCTGCHGAPPPDHAQSQCAICHPASAKHIDGAVQVGRTTGCDGCHGTARSPAPPVDLAGNTLTTAIGVGAHQAHLQVPSHMRGPVPCATCHQVPATIDAAGHIDSPPPAEVEAALGWDRTAQTCATAWCHVAAQPRWTENGGAFCGSCHGVPPATPSHNPNMSLTSCATCHPRSISPAGNFIFAPDGTSKHINGTVDFF
jgi:predicted CxxxxCH...CXXCH cytochrome family protein